MTGASGMALVAPRRRAYGRSLPGASLLRRSLDALEVARALPVRDGPLVGRLLAPEEVRVVLHDLRAEGLAGEGARREALARLAQAAGDLGQRPGGVHVAREERRRLR